jgi:hypothetical protein
MDDLVFKRRFPTANSVDSVYMAKSDYFIVICPICNTQVTISIPPRETLE